MAIILPFAIAHVTPIDSMVDATMSFYHSGIENVSRQIKINLQALMHNELLQMAGRAGRRGFDTQGQCVLLQTKCALFCCISLSSLCCNSHGCCEGI